MGARNAGLWFLMVKVTRFGFAMIVLALGSLAMIVAIPLKAQSVTLPNLGGDMGGHTPRGFKIRWAKGPAFYSFVCGLKKSATKMGSRIWRCSSNRIPIRMRAAFLI